MLPQELEELSVLKIIAFSCYLSLFSFCIYIISLLYIFTVLSTRSGQDIVGTLFKYGTTKK